MPVICIILGAALVAALVWLYLLYRDIRQLRENLLNITQSDTNSKLTTDTFNKDVVGLTASINTMLERNRRDIFEKAGAEAALKRAVTNISHDLRTPLTSALGYLQMLTDSGLNEETKLRYLETVRGRLETLSVLMNNLFEFARVMEGDVAYNIQPCNICNVLRDALSDNYMELENKGFAVDADIPDMPVICRCDKDALRRVLQNLLKNAVVHGREHLRVRLDGDAIEIANKADGLADMDTGKMFERFYTSDAARTSGNTGLGLAIARELVTRMEGNITAYVDGDYLVMRLALPQVL